MRSIILLCDENQKPAAKPSLHPGKTIYHETLLNRQLTKAYRQTLTTYTYHRLVDPIHVLTEEAGVHAKQFALRGSCERFPQVNHVFWE